MLLQDKVIIVTGGGGGLGAGIARVCAREGARVVVADVRDAAAAEVVAELGGAKAIACDIRDDAALDELVATTVDSFGRIDGLVNNAGANFAKPFMQTTEQDWEWVVSLDLRAVFFSYPEGLSAAAEPGRGWEYRQYLQRTLGLLSPRCRSLRCGQVGCCRHGQEHGCRAGTRRDSCQCHLSWVTQYADLAGSAECRTKPRSLPRLLAAEYPHRTSHRTGRGRGTRRIPALRPQCFDHRSQHVRRRWHDKPAGQQGAIRVCRD